MAELGEALPTADNHKVSGGSSKKLGDYQLGFKQQVTFQLLPLFFYFFFKFFFSGASADLFCVHNESF